MPNSGITDATIFEGTRAPLAPKVQSSCSSCHPLKTAFLPVSPLPSCTGFFALAVPISHQSPAHCTPITVVLSYTICVPSASAIVKRAVGGLSPDVVAGTASTANESPSAIFPQPAFGLFSSATWVTQPVHPFFSTLPVCIKKTQLA